MPTHKDLVRTLEDLDMPHQDVMLWKKYLAKNDVVQKAFGGGDTLNIGRVNTKRKQWMYKAAETKIGNAGQQISTFTWTVPADGTHLMIMMNAGTDHAGTNSKTSMRFNGDTGSNYEYQGDAGLGAVESASNSGNIANLLLIDIPGTGAPANTSGGAVIFIPHYNSDLFKTAHMLLGSVDTADPLPSYVAHIYGWWKDTSKIKTITIYDENGSDWSVGSVFSLYVIP